MKIIEEIDASDFERESWSAGYFWEKLHNARLEREFNAYAEEMFPEGAGKTEFNDWIRFEADEILAAIGYSEEDQGEYDFYESICKKSKKNSKIKESTKITLTIGQLKKLVKESISDLEDSHYTFKGLWSDEYGSIEYEDLDLSDCLTAEEVKDKICKKYENSEIGLHADGVSFNVYCDGKFAFAGHVGDGVEFCDNEQDLSVC